MAKITSIEFCVADCPLETAAIFATRVVKSRQYLLVRIGCDDGHEGIGATYCGDDGGEAYVAVIENLLGKLLIGHDPFLTEAHWARLYQHALLQGRSGIVLRTLGALDIALWDHNAKAAALPLWKYLGAYHDGMVPAYASGGYYYPENDIDNLQKEMAGYVAKGFTAVKMKVGRKAVSEDHARVAAARDAIGPDVRLMLDANNAWPDVPTALSFLRKVEPLDPFWIEEPFSPDEIGNHARLAKSTSISIAGGEIESNRWRFLEAIQQNAIQILQPDVFACGGISEWRKIANLAGANGMSVCTHAWHDFHAPLMASVPNAMFVEYFSDNRIVNLQTILDQPLALDSGMLVLSQEPGLGFGFDAAAVEPNQNASWQSIRIPS